MVDEKRGYCKSRMIDECPICMNAEDQKAKTAVINWIQCAECSQWYHLHCLEILKSQADKIASYHCRKCEKMYGPSIQKRTSKRQRRLIDYVALDSGEVDSVTLDDHPHVKRFLDSDLNDSSVTELKGEDLTLGYALATRLPYPVKIPGDKREDLGLFVPPEFDISSLVESMGEDHRIEIMDVLTQNGAKNGWNLGQWRDYFLSPKSEHARILNVLSLEISKCTLGERITRPNYVNDVDLVDRVWPQELESEKPYVQKYCLMGVEDSYTDFHLDFAGSSVYYTILRGSKVFMFFPPTEFNIKKYVHWIKHEGNKFLPDLGLENGIKVELKPNDVLIIPSGWIHSVYTPIDTVVIGGNFLTSFNLDIQFRIAEVEVETKVPQKFKFPKFDKVMWFTAKAILDGDIKSYEVDIKGLNRLVQYLKEKKIPQELTKFIGEPSKSIIAGLQKYIKNEFGEINTNTSKLKSES